MYIQWVTTLSLTMWVYLHSFSRYKSAKSREIPRELIRT